MLFYLFFNEITRNGTKMTPGDAKSEKMAPQGEQKGAKGRQKGANWSQK